MDKDQGIVFGGLMTEMSHVRRILLKITVPSLDRKAASSPLKTETPQTRKISFSNYIALPKTNSKSTWKWMVGIRSFPEYRRKAYIQGQFVSLRGGICSGVFAVSLRGVCLEMLPKTNETILRDFLGLWTARMSEHSKKMVMGKYMGHMNFSPIFLVFFPCMSFFFSRSWNLRTLTVRPGETRWIHFPLKQLETRWLQACLVTKASISIPQFHHISTKSLDVFQRWLHFYSYTSLHE